jgi:hypothetical protein
VFLAAVVMALTIEGQSLAQESESYPNPAEVASLDAIVGALYHVISGPAGPRDWHRFHSLFDPDARLIPTGRTPEGAWEPRAMTPEGYVERAGEYFATNGFFQEEIARRVELYGHIAHVFSTYQSRTAADQEPFIRGINSIQLFDDGNRWWIVSIMWDDERGGGPIPERYLLSQP